MARPQNNWTPTLGQHVLGAGIGIADLAALVAVEGQVVINLKEASPTLDLRGELNIPATGDKYMIGDVYATYVLGENRITGRARSNLNFPPSGNLVSVVASGIYFDVSKEQITVASRNIQGTLLGRYPFSGAYELLGELSGEPPTLTAFGGRLAVNLHYDASFAYTYPTGFQPDVGSGFGFSITGRCLMSGWSTLKLYDGNLTGETAVELNGNAVGHIRYPAILGIGGGTAMSYGGLRCLGKVKKDTTNSLLTFSGDITVYYNDYEGSASVSNLPIY